MKTFLGKGSSIQAKRNHVKAPLKKYENMALKREEAKPQWSTFKNV